MFARVGKAINLMHGFTQACAAMAAANLGAHICLERSLAKLDIQADDSRAESGRIRSDGLSKGSALLSEVTRTGSLGHEFRRSQYIAPKPNGRAYPVAYPAKEEELSAGRVQLFLDVFATNGVGMC
jgi:hypothetical protein